MPPKAKFTRQQIIQAGLEIVRREGIDGLTARALGKELGSSVCPVFTVFESMDELHSEVKKAAKALYAEYVRKGLEQVQAFKGVGTQYIMFAVNEPKLFQILFMSEQDQKTGVSVILPVIDDSYEDILNSVRREYNVGGREAEELYRHLWIYTHGIAALCATNTCVFTADEINKMMTRVFKGILKEIKGDSVI